MNNRGGKRKGAGRKALPEHLKKQPCPLKLPRWVIDYLNGLPDSRAVAIEKALIKTYNLKEPRA